MCFIDCQIEQLQRKRRGDSTAGKENDDFERWKDIKNYFFMSKFDNTNPEREIYSQFESKMGIALNDWVRLFNYNQIEFFIN